MKHALIVGASGDIGIETAKQLAAQGWSLYLHYNQQNEKITELITKLHAKYPKQDFLSFSFDMSTATNLDKFLENIFELDTIIFAQGTTTYKLLVQTTREEIQHLWSMQVAVPIEIIKALQEKLAKSSHGRIIFVGSVYGAVGSAMEVSYSMVKGAQTAFANAYAKEVASLGITVNVVAPGAVDTHMNQFLAKNERQAITDDIPTGKFATPADIAFWIVQLTNQAAGYMTGQTIYVDGGWLK